MKVVLSLDGGGVRGVLALAFVERIEALLGTNPEAPLARYVDLAGGTSTGSIIAGALALGMSGTDIHQLYTELAGRVFRRSMTRLPGVQSRFRPTELKAQLQAVFGDRRLESDDLLTGFALVTKRLDTGSPWIVSNNSGAPYWADPADGSYLGNRHYRLADLIRASTAAPYYFAPEEIAIAEGEPPGLFVDGGVSPHNNPAMALLQLVGVPALGFGWPMGMDKLRIISIGTGSHRPRLNAAAARRMPAAGLAVNALTGLMSDSEAQTLTLMHLLGQTPTPWKLNSEVGDLGGYTLTPKPLFGFLRYDVRLEADWLQAELGLSLPEKEIIRLRQLDDASTLPLLYEIGQIAAEKFVRPQHLAGMTARPA